MSSLSSNVLRLICHADRPDRVLDQRTGHAPAILKGFDYTVQLGVFVDGVLLDSVVNWQSVTLEVRALAAGAPTGAALITKTVSTGFAVPSSADWLAKIAQHASLSLSADETAVAAADLWIAVHVLTAAGEKFFLAYGNFKVIESGQTGDPQDNATAYYTLAEADARYARRAPVDGGFRLSSDGLFIQLKDSATLKWRSIWFAAGVLQTGPEED